MSGAGADFCMADPPGIPEGSSMTCPPWCKRPPGEEHVHRTAHHYASETYEFSASVLLDEFWDKPRLFIYHPGMPTGSYGVLIPLNQAADMAQLMTALGQPGAAAAITRAVAELAEPAEARA